MAVARPRVGASATRPRRSPLLAAAAFVVMVGAIVVAASADGAVAVAAAVVVGLVLVYEAVFWLRVASGRDEWREAHRAS